MQPDKSKILISDNKNLILEMLSDLVLEPRLKALKWAKITKQTPNMKIGYPGQHLASLITGVPGTRTGARGHDLLDGSETKSCSRVDQVDKCNACGSKVMRLEDMCPDCDSTDIKRNDDSKWLFTIRTQDDLKLLTQEVPRIVLALADYPFMSQGDFDTISFKTFEIWPAYKRHTSFVDLMKGYYESIYLGHKNTNSAKTPAPKNFWPYSYQFYKCNPVLTFSAKVKNSNSKPEVEIETLISTDANRELLTPIPMPSALLNFNELLQVIRTSPDEDLSESLADGVTLNALKKQASLGIKNRKDLIFLRQMMPTLNETMRAPLPLRDTDKPKSMLKAYVRT